MVSRTASLNRLAPLAPPLRIGMYSFLKGSSGRSTPFEGVRDTVLGRGLPEICSRPQKRLGRVRINRARPAAFLFHRRDGRNVVGSHPLTETILVPFAWGDNRHHLALASHRAKTQSLIAFSIVFDG